jgi:hypothetical protein
MEAQTRLPVYMQRITLYIHLCREGLATTLSVLKFLDNSKSIIKHNIFATMLQIYCSLLVVCWQKQVNVIKSYHAYLPRWLLNGFVLRKHDIVAQGAGVKYC